MIPANQPITLTRGDYFPMGLRIRTMVWDPTANDDAGGYVPSDYRDLTGCTVLGQIRKTTEDPTVLATFTATILNQVDDATVGKVRLELFHEDTKDLPLTDDKAKLVWGYDIQVLDPSGEPETYVTGSVKVKGDYSRDD